MAVKEFFSKYKLYTILAVVVAVLVAGGVTLGILLSHNTTPPADAVTGDVYIMADGTVTSADNYDFALDIYYSSESATVCRLDRVTRNASSTATTIVIPETVTINGTPRTITTMYGRNSISSSNAVFYPIRSFITEVFLPDTITNIGYYAFRDCSSLTSVYIPYGVTTIQWNSFSGCSSLQSVVIPDSVTRIDTQAFSGCSSLTSINIPDSVTSIGNSAFESCSSLTSINIPDSVTSIGNSAFFNCTSLISIEVDGNNPNYKDDNGVLYIKDGTRLMACPAGTTLTEYNILDTTTTIEDYAFYNCSGLTSPIVIPDGVTSIESYTFYGCENLPSITIPDSVTSIGNSAFNGCSSLTSINIPSSVTSIGQSAFDDCSSLTSINIPDSVTSIGSSAFSGCTSLTSINIPDGVTSIESHTFNGCENLPSITIPSSVTSIGSSAFSGCSSLTSINIPDGVTSIEYGTFYDCHSLPSITIPDSVTSIGGWAFYGCSSLTSINIPDSVTSIGNSAFEYCSSLINVYFYNDITSDTSMIGSFAFSSNNSNVTYWFKDQTSLDNAIAIDTANTNKFTGPSDHSNFKLMEWNVSVNCNENFGALSYTEPASITYGTEITATVTPNGSAEFLYWEVKVTQNGNEIASEQIANTTLNYTITDFGTYTFTAVFDFDILITSESGGAEFDITRQTDDSIVKGYLINMKDGYYINRIALVSNDGTISQDLYQEVSSLDGYLNTGTYCLALHYITNTTGTELVLEVYYAMAPFTIYLGFTTEPQNYTAGGSVDGVAVSVAYQSADGSINADETTISAIGEARIKGYTTIDGVEYVTLEAVAYTGYAFVGWQVDGEFISYTDDTNGTITLTGSAYRTANIPLSLIDGKQVFAMFE